MMKIVSWNINGIRATTDRLKELLKSSNADILCLQETKITRDQLESDVAIIDGYNSYFSFSQSKSGYSGVATFCKNSFTPLKAQSGLSSSFENDAGETFVGCYGNLSHIFQQERLHELDREGRAIITQHCLETSNKDEPNLLTIINVYCPRADPEKEDRKLYKLDFYKALEERSKALIGSNSYVLVVGDINTSHKTIDHCDPSDPVLFYDNLSRAWLDSFIYSNGDYSKLPDIDEHDICDRTLQGMALFVDSFRYFYPKKLNMYTCWCTSNRARQTNYGTRIDYIFCDVFLARYLNAASILTNFLGSDHCPIEAILNISVISSEKCPFLCTSFIKEFGGKQQKLLTYFTKPSTGSQETKKSNLSNKRSCSIDTSDDLTFPNKQRKTSQLKLTSFINKNDKTTKSKKEKIGTVSTNNKLSKSSSRSNFNKDASAFWKNILKGPPPAPLCSGHSEPCVLRTVKKVGPNVGRQFYCCARPEGHKSNPEANCQFFKWTAISKK